MVSERKPWVPVAAARLVVSANPGCLVQISSGLKRAGKHVPVLHMIELIDAAIQGTPAAELQARR